MKIIELLNKIANGEEVPKNIKVFDEEFNYDGYDYYSIHSSSPLMSYVGADYLRAEMNYDIEIIFKTDKLVLDNNADKIDGNIYKWTDLSKDLILQVSKKETPSNSKSKKDNTVLRLIITLVVILVMTVLFIQRKSQAKNNK